MIKKPLSKKDKRHNQQAFYTYAANKTEVIDRRDANARICFQRKPWYMIQEERIRDGREEDTDYSADY